MSSTDILWVNLPALRENLHRLRSFASDARCFGVVKANAYGLGAAEVAKFIENDVDMLCVAVPEEIKQLVDAGITKPLLCLGLLPDDWMDYFVSHTIRPTVYTVAAAEKLNAIAKTQNTTLPIHIKLDTGHTRIGFMWNDADTIASITEIANMENLKIEGIYSHFAAADEEDRTYTEDQIRRFKEVTDHLIADGIDIGMRHLANDAGLIMYHPEAVFDAVRVGIGLYGEYPSDYVDEQQVVELLPVVRWEATINNVKEIESGTAVSYGRSWTSEEPTRLATIQVGYADGYFRALSNQADVIINGKRCRIRGRVCMDQMMVDVTQAGDVQIGDKAILLGQDPNGSERITGAELGHLANTISYEILTHIGTRVDRKYIY